MKKKIKQILGKLPGTHGVYQFFNASGQIIYIGKSVNLKSRVNSYFNGKSKLNFAKQKMVKLIENIKIIITNNETESLILETTLIKKHLPKYNILMKDGKNHIYIKITDEKFSKIIKTRIKNKNGIYFGPYTSTFYVNNILKLIKTIFGYGIGNHNFFVNKKNYNLDKYLFKNELELKDYGKKIEQIKKFLKGDTNKIKQYLEKEMKQKAKALMFEQANKIKQDIESIKMLEENQIVREGVNGSYNIVNFIDKFDKIFIGMIEIRNGKITGFYNFDIENKLQEDKEIVLKKFIELNYVENEYLKRKIIYLSPINLELNSKILYEIPKIGTKKELLDLCYKNIYEYAHKSHLNSLSTKGFTKKTMQNLLNILGYKQINKKILFECNDVSHISGSFTVASRSVIENGKSKTSMYKKYKIKTLSEGKIDDFGSMKELIIRRIKELENKNNKPDLIIIDGGKGQLSSVNSILKEHNINLQIIGIAKREEELFLPLKSNPIILKKDSNELRLIQKIRDEAHRFAITYNRNSRIKAMKKNILEELPGFGPKTRKKLLNKYGNIDNISKTSKKELLETISKNQLDTLIIHGLIN